MRRVLFFLASLLFATSIRAQHLVLSEVMYAPRSPEPEWIEIYNSDSADVNTTSLTLRVGTRSVTLPAVHIPARAYAVITRDTSLLRASRGSGFALIQANLPSLRNTGDTLALHSLAATLDSMMYLQSWGGNSGRSLERRAPWLSGMLAGSWRECLDTSGATPGFANSVAIVHRDLAITSLTYHFDHRLLIAQARVENVGSDTIAQAGVLLSAEGLTASAPITASIAPDSSELVTLTLAGTSLDAYLLTGAVQTSDDERHTNDTLRLAVPAGLPNGAIVLNEVLFAPIAPEPEWIELHNPAGNDLQLAGLQVQVNASRSDLPNIALPAHGYRAVTARDSLLIVLHSLRPSDVLHADLPTLSNSGAPIAIIDARGVTIDSMHYTAGLVRTGQSLERIDPYRSATDSSAWKACLDSSGTTLLRINSTLLKSTDLAIRNLRLDSGNVLAEVLNHGLDSVRGFSVDLFIEGDRVGSFASDTTLPPYATVPISLALDAAIPAGRFELEAVVHCDRDSNESNDTARSTCNVNPLGPNDLLLNEIMFEPATGEPEWLELANSSARSISLRDCQLVIGDTSRQTRLHLKPTVIPSSSYAVVAANSSIYTRWPELLGRSGLCLLTTSSLGLTNDSQDVALRSADSITIDSLRYHLTWHNKALQETQGVSLERRSFGKPSTDPANWTSSTSPRGATPLAANSTGYLMASGNELSVSLDVNPLPADGSTRTTVEIASPIPDGMRRLRLFGRGGQVVRSFPESLWSGFERIAFDATDDDGRPLQPGLYTLLVEVADPSGRTTARRAGLVIAPPK